MFYDIERERGADPATALTRRLTRFGAITSCIVYPRDVIGPFDAHVTFDSAAAAEACVTHLRCVEGETNVALFYNSTPYSGRGWCLLEESASMMITSQLARAATQQPLLARYAHAESSRPKMLDLNGEATHAREATMAPSAYLEEAGRLLSTAQFSVESDRASAMEANVDLNWLVNRALEQARIDPLAYATNPQKSPSTNMLVAGRISSTANDRGGLRLHGESALSTQGEGLDNAT